jgi:predicted alpha/beta hydrolase family esterase
MPALRSTLRPALLAGALFAAAACSDAVPTAPLPVDGLALQRTSDVSPASGVWGRIVLGETGPGALYAVYVPRDWNGDVVYYAHGFRDVSEELTLRDQDRFEAFRDALGADGYAVAYSSFAENGFAVKSGILRTHQLRGVVASIVDGPVDQSFLAGHSLGGAVVVALAERFPQQYDGALAMCGMVGGSRLQTEYVGNVRALFDAFYPGVLDGSLLDVDGAAFGPAEQMEVIAAVTANPAGMIAIASTLQTPLPFTNVNQLVESLLRTVGFHIRGVDDIVDRTHGQSPFDNAGTIYTVNPAAPPLGLTQQQLAGLLQLANATVERTSITPAAANYLANYYQPTGDLRIPLVTLHNFWDPVVPFLHEPALATIVAAAGASGMLEQRTAFSYGHCNFTTAEAMGAFEAMVTRAGM